MHRLLFSFFIGFILFTSCGESGTKNSKPQPLVHEGMSAAELRSTLGEPLKIEVKNQIFDAQSMTKMSLEHWVYEKRVVILINDTVKNTNLN